MMTMNRAMDIPTNLLSSHTLSDVFFDSLMAEKALLQRYLPHNSGEDSDNADPYATDHFRMYEFKVRRCTRPRCHDWTECPFVHPGEKARRRDPRKYHYSGTVCAEFRRGGSCPRGDNCEFSHGVFENWLHPAKYRTEACKDGKNCKRKICFFAHTPRQLRLLPPSPPSPPPENPSSFLGLTKDYLNGCRFCHSPTSTLMAMSQFDKLSLSPPMSPPSLPPSLLSPVKSPFSAVSCGVKQFNMSPLSYRDVVNSELRGCFEDMKLSEDDDEQHEQFSGVSPMGARVGFGDSRRGSDEQHEQFSVFPMGARVGLESRRGSVGSGLGGPDVDWVNDLLT